MISPELIFMGLRAVIRTGTAAKASYEQHVRDRGFVMAGVLKLSTTLDDHVRDLFQSEAHKMRIADGGDLRDAWRDANQGSGSAKAAAWEKLHEEAARVWAAEGKETPDIVGVSFGLTELEQWKSEKAPTDPGIRFALTMTDILLEFVGSNPSLIGVDGNAEKLVRSLSLNVRGLLPDPDATQIKFDNVFAERATAIFLQGALQALADNAGAMIAEDHLEELVTEGLAPVIKKLAPVSAGQARAASIRDDLLGPIATAAVTVLAKRQKEFLGNRFDSGKALGAVMQSYLQTTLAAGEVDLQSVFGKEGVIRIATASLEVAASKPELFVGTGTDPDDTILRGLLQDVAKTLSKKPGPFPFNGAAATDVAIAALRSFSSNATVLFDPGNPWKSLAGEGVGLALSMVVEGIEGALENGTAKGLFEDVFSRENAVAYAKIFLDQAARTPGMLVGEHAGEELKNIVCEVTKALGSKASLLLSTEDILEIVAVAAEEAARNPGRLFHIDSRKPEGRIGAVMIQTMLRAAAKDLGATGEALENMEVDASGMAAGRAAGALMFGETLRDAITTALRVAAGNAKAALVNEGKLLELVDGLNALAKREDSPIGQREWLFLLKRLAAESVANPDKVMIDEASLLALLSA